MRTTKVFSAKDGTIFISDKSLQLIYFKDKFDIGLIIASTDEKLCIDFNKHLLPPTLIRTPKSDEELAEEKYPEIEILGVKLTGDVSRGSFIAGRKSYGADKEFHLSREQLDKIFAYGLNDDTNGYQSFINSLTPSIYPTRIEVDYDGTNYFWETLKAYY